MSSFGHLLKKYRKRVGLSQQYLATKSGVDKSYISRLESGSREVPSRSLALTIAEILNLSTEEIELWLMSGGYVSPRLQAMAGGSEAKLLEVISLLDEE